MSRDHRTADQALLKVSASPNSMRTLCLTIVANLVENRELNKSLYWKLLVAVLEIKNDISPSNF